MFGMDYVSLNVSVFDDLDRFSHGSITLAGTDNRFQTVEFSRDLIKLRDGVLAIRLSNTFVSVGVDEILSSFDYIGIRSIALFDDQGNMAYVGLKEAELYDVRMRLVDTDYRESGECNSGAGCFDGNCRSGWDLLPACSCSKYNGLGGIFDETTCYEHLPSECASERIAVQQLASNDTLFTVFGDLWLNYDSHVANSVSGVPAVVSIIESIPALDIVEVCSAGLLTDLYDALGDEMYCSSTGMGYKGTIETRAAIRALCGPCGSPFVDSILTTTADNGYTAPDVLCPLVSRSDCCAGSAGDWLAESQLLPENLEGSCGITHPELAFVAPCDESLAIVQREIADCAAMFGPSLYSQCMGDGEFKEIESAEMVAMCASSCIPVMYQQIRRARECIYTVNGGSLGSLKAEMFIREPYIEFACSVEPNSGSLCHDLGSPVFDSEASNCTTQYEALGCCFGSIVNLFNSPSVSGNDDIGAVLESFRSGCIDDGFSSVGTCSAPSFVSLSFGVVNATMTADGTGIDMYFEAATDEAADVSCSFLSSLSRAQLGSAPSCSWLDAYTMRITLGVSPIINKDSVLIVEAESIRSAESFTYYVAGTSVSLSGFEVEVKVDGGVTEIDFCSGLALSTTSSTGGFGQALMFSYTVSNFPSGMSVAQRLAVATALSTQTGSSVSLPSSLLYGGSWTFSISAVNWLGGSGTTTHEVGISVLAPPTISFDKTRHRTISRSRSASNAVITATMSRPSCLPTTVAVSSSWSSADSYPFGDLTPTYRVENQSVTLPTTAQSSRFLYIDTSVLTFDTSYFFVVNMELDLSSALGISVFAEEYVLVEMKRSTLSLSMTGAGSLLSTSADPVDLKLVLFDPDKTVDTVVWDWEACTVSSSANPAGRQCFADDAALAGADGSVWEFAPSDLTLFANETEVKVTIQASASKLSRTASTQSSFTVTVDEVPTVFIVSATSFEKWVVSRRLVLIADFDTSYLADPTTSLVWYSKTDGFTLSRSNVLSLLDSSYSLVLKSNTLTADTEYTIGFNLTVNGFTGVGEYTFTTAPRMTVGECFSTPEAGVFGDTEFTFNCSGFSDGTELTYCFSAIQGNGNPVLLECTSSNTFTPEFVAPGDLSFRTTVVSEYGTEVVSPFSVNVSLPTGSDTANLAASFSSRVASKILQGDVNGAVQGLAVTQRLLRLSTNVAALSKGVVTLLGQIDSLTGQTKTIGQATTFINLMGDGIDTSDELDEASKLSMTQFQANQAEHILSTLRSDSGSVDSEFVSKPVAESLDRVLDDLQNSGNITEDQAEEANAVFLRTMETLRDIQLVTSVIGEDAKVTSTANLFLQTQKKLQRELSNQVIEVISDLSGDDEESLLGGSVFSGLRSLFSARPNADVTRSPRVGVPSDLFTSVNASDEVSYSFQYSSIDSLSGNRKLTTENAYFDDDVPYAETNATSKGAWVVSFTLLGSDGDEIVVNNTNTPFNITIPHDTINPLDLSVEEVSQVSFCRYWAENGWRGDGCVAVDIQPTYTVCECSHLTDFSVDLRDFEPQARSLSAQDFLNLTWSNLMDHPITLITIFATCVLYLLLLPAAHAIDKKNADKYDYLTEGILQEAARKRQGVQGGALPMSARLQPNSSRALPVDAVDPANRLGRNITDLRDADGDSNDEEILVDERNSAPVQAGETDFEGEGEGEANDGSESAASPQHHATSMEEIELGNLSKSNLRDVNGEGLDSKDEDDENDDEENPSGEAHPPFSSSMAFTPSFRHGLVQDLHRENLSVYVERQERHRRSTVENAPARWKRNKNVATFVHEFRQRHLWFSIWFHHPRCRVNSKQRLSAVLALILGTLAIGAAFFGSQKIVADLVVIIISSIATLPATLLLLFLWRGGSCDSSVMSKEEVAKRKLGLPIERRGCLGDRGVVVAWVFWGFWCTGCILLALVYGLQFDLENDDRKDESGANLISIGAATLTARWLISCALANLQDIIINRPIFIGVRTYVTQKLMKKN